MTTSKAGMVISMDFNFLKQFIYDMYYVVYSILYMTYYISDMQYNPAILILLGKVLFLYESLHKIVAANWSLLWCQLNQWASILAKRNFQVISNFDEISVYMLIYHIFF